MTYICRLCPNNCGADRDKSDGICHADNDMRVCRISPHFYEEPIISGENGSGTIFFSGCSLDCEFCQNYKISKSKVGKVYTPKDLAEALKNLEQQGVHNINFVTPTHFSHKIKEALDIYHPKIPIVYNTSGYEKPEIIEELKKYVDIYLADMKYGDKETSYKYSKRNDYCEYNFAAVEKMVQQKPTIIENGIMKQGVIIRHLVLPDNLLNTEKIIALYADKYKGKAVFSVMSQFFPCYKSSIQRSLKPIEYKIVIRMLEKYGIDDCYIQELSSASDFYTPIFEL